MITGKNLNKSFFGEPVLQDVSFTINQGQKIGLIGQNGGGKTTLFRIINGLEEPDNGRLIFDHERLGYIPQIIEFEHELVGEYLENIVENPLERFQIDILVNQTKFSNYDPYQNTNTLSEGQKLKLKLIGTMLANPTTIFIDEPTNHLDIEGIMWLENYLANFQQAVVMISHDRSFLNHVANQIWEIEDHQLRFFAGNYDNYQQQKHQLIQRWDREYKLFIRKKAQLEKLLENAHKIQDGKARSRAISSAQHRIKREVTDQSKEKYQIKKISSVLLEAESKSAKLMLRAKNLGKKFERLEVFHDLDFEIRGGEKVWLFGPNGAGKTTLVKLIIGEEPPSCGELVLGENISLGYFAQKQTHLEGNRSVLEEFKEQTKCEHGKAFGVLKKFLFVGDFVQKKVKFLSPGEQARLAFCIFSYKNHDLLILDEPTNHLDIQTKEVVEQSLREYKGTLILVSHDRYFVEEIGMTKLFNLKEGCLEWL